MLPFLQPKKMASVVMSARKADGTEATRSTEGENAPAHVAMAEKLISAIHSKNAQEVASILAELIGAEDAADKE
jgi:hypothetical protein